MFTLISFINTVLGSYEPPNSDVRKDHTDCSLLFVANYVKRQCPRVDVTLRDKHFVFELHTDHSDINLILYFYRGDNNAVFEIKPADMQSYIASHRILEAARRLLKIKDLRDAQDVPTYDRTITEAVEEIGYLEKTDLYKEVYLKRYENLNIVCESNQVTLANSKFMSILETCRLYVNNALVNIQPPIEDLTKLLFYFTLKNDDGITLKSDLLQFTYGLQTEDLSLKTFTENIDEYVSPKETESVVEICKRHGVAYIEENLPIEPDKSPSEEYATPPHEESAKPLLKEPEESTTSLLAKYDETEQGDLSEPSSLESVPIKPTKPLFVESTTSLFKEPAELPPDEFVGPLPKESVIAESDIYSRSKRKPDGSKTIDH